MMLTSSSGWAHSPITSIFTASGALYRLPSRRSCRPPERASCPADRALSRVSLPPAAAPAGPAHPTAATPTIARTTVTRLMSPSSLRPRVRPGSRLAHTTLSNITEHAGELRADCSGGQHPGDAGARQLGLGQKTGRGGFREARTVVARV